MSMAVCLVPCRKISSTTSSVLRRALLWKQLRRIAKVTGAVVLGGCVFITYEVMALNKAVTIDTQAILQEKFKSFIYLSAPPGDEQGCLGTGLTTLARKELHKAVRKLLEISSKLRHLPLDEHLSRVDADPHECALWVLLKRASSSNWAVRLQAVRDLAENHHWMDYQYRNAAQASDQRTAIGLARSLNVDLRFFLSPPMLPERENGTSLEDDLRELLASLPQSEVDACVRYFTSLALMESSQSVAAQRGGLWCFGGDGLPYAQSLTPVPSEKVESFCLEALVQHSKVPSHCQAIVAAGGLELLQRVFQHRESSPKIQRNVICIIANLALDQSLHASIVQSGWLPVLARTARSPHIMQASYAARALANLDRDTVGESFQDGVYVLHPQSRTSQHMKADVLFIHGLLGAAFKTWRQQDCDLSEKEGNAQEDYTECWPKSWLAVDCPSLRILSVEYDTHLSDWMAKCPAENQRKTLAYRSQELLKKLQAAGVGSRPLVWVSHSMGGLLVKKMLLDASSDPALRPLLENTKGVMFYSVPHHGTAMAEYSVNVGYLFFPSAEVRELCRDSPALRELNEAFLSMARERDIQVLSFTETLPTTVGPMMKMLVVSPQSADLGLGNLIKVNVNHLNICKPERKNSFLYQRSLHFITDVLRSQLQ